MTTSLWKKSAVEIVDLVNTKEVTCLEVTDAILARIDAVNPNYNAIVYVDHEGARASAVACDTALGRGIHVGALPGVAVSIKLNIDVEGQATDDGCVPLKNRIAAEDAPLVANLRRNGAAIAGRCNAPAFSIRVFTDNELHGRTLNPFAADRTPGGSSGGAAVAAALGFGPIHIGNDVGGSIRHPAWANGVVGLRPSIGRVPHYQSTARNEKSLSWQLFEAHGPLTRSVADARLALQVISRGDPRDPQWVPALLELEPPRSRKVALFNSWSGCPTHPSVSASLIAAATALEAAGYVVEERAVPHFEETLEMRSNLLFDDIRRRAADVEEFGDTASKNLFRNLTSQRAPGNVDEVLAAYQRRMEIMREWAKFLVEYPLILMPTSWRPQLPIDHDQKTPEHYAEVLTALSPVSVVSLLSYPGLSVPTGISEGLPTGIQLVAANFREDLMFEAGEIIEAACRFSTFDHLD